MKLFPPEFLARLERLEVRARRPASGMSYGRGKSASAGSGVEFVDLREYSPGDDLRAVDWNLYARLDKLLLRVFRQEREHDVHVLLDVSRSMVEPDATKYVRATQIAAAIAYVGLARMDRVSLWPVAGAVGEPDESPKGDRGRTVVAGGMGVPFPLAAGKRRAAAMFRYLEKVKPGGVTDLCAAAETFARQTPRGVVVVVSDFYDLGDGSGKTGARGGLARLVRSGFEVLAIQVTGAQDDAPKESGTLDLVDGETGRVVRMRVDRKTRRAYAELLENERTAIAQMLASAGGAFAIAPPERALEDVLLRDLRRAGVVA